MNGKSLKAVNAIAKTWRICGIFFIFCGVGGSLQAKGVVGSLLYLIGLPFLGISLIVSGTFMMKLRQWARKLFTFQMCLIIGCVIWGVIRYCIFSWVDVVCFSVTFLPVPMYSIYYITRPKVREQFK